MPRSVTTPSFAMLVQRFFTEHLTNHRAVSPRTVTAYGDTFRLLLQFAERHTSKSPTHLKLVDLDAKLVLAFLDHLSEIIDLRVENLILDTSPSIHLTGKGRKQRSVPLWRSTITVMRAWKRRSGTTTGSAPLFPNRSGKAMSRSNVTQRPALAVEVAAEMNPQLHARSISPHTFRHTTAMHLLQSGVDMAVIALWLGHESPSTTHMYLEADLAMKERALGRLQAPTRSGMRYKPPDRLLQFLQGL